MNFNLYLVGVGGQGILTIGELLSSAAFHKEIPVNFFPSRGMAQRGGHVRAQLRLGRGRMGPNIAERSADLVIAMELSEAIKAVRYIRPGGDFLLYEETWLPTAALLGKAPYPQAGKVREAVRAAGARLVSILPEDLPQTDLHRLAPNLFLLGAAVRGSGLGQLFSSEDLQMAIRERWPKGAEGNLRAFQAGWEAPLHLPTALSAGASV